VAKFGVASLDYRCAWQRALVVQDAGEERVVVPSLPDQGDSGRVTLVFGFVPLGAIVCETPADMSKTRHDTVAQFRKHFL
jgi:hypothetical protein